MTIIVLWILLGIIAVIVILLHFSVTVYVKGGTDGEFDFKIKYMGFTVYPRPAKKKKNKKPKRVKNKKEKPVEDQDDFDEFDDDLEEEINSALSTANNTDTEEIIPSVSVGESSSEETVVDRDTDLQDISENNKAAVENNVKSDSPSKPAETKSKKSFMDRFKKDGKNNPKREKSNKTDISSSNGKLDDLKQKFAMIKPYIPIGWKYFKKMLKAIRFTGVRINVVTGKEDAYESAMFYGKIQAALFNLLAVLAGIFTVKIKQADVQCVFNEKKLEAHGETYVRVRPSTMIAIAICIGVSFLKIYLPQRKKNKKSAKAAAAEVQTETKSNDGENAA